MPQTSPAPQSLDEPQFEYVVETVEDAEVFTDRAEALKYAERLVDEQRDDALITDEWSLSIEDIKVYERRIIAWASPVSGPDSESVDYVLAEAAAS